MADIEIPDTGDPRVDAALSRIRDKFTDLEDAVTVQAFLEKKFAERTKEHAQLLADHADARREHEEWYKHIQYKLDALTDIVMRREGGSEARP